MRAEIKTLLPSSVMVKISLADFVQIALLLATLYMTLHYKQRTEVNILGDYRARFSFSFFFFSNVSTKGKLFQRATQTHSSGGPPSSSYSPFKHPTKITQQQHPLPPTLPQNKNSLLNKVRL